MNEIKLAVGDGGEEYRDFLNKFVFPYTKNDFSKGNEDSVNLPFNSDNLFFTSDTFVVDPPVFPGGNIGNLAICGTANDISVAGARPLHFSLSIMVEEGYKINDFLEIMKSIQYECNIGKIHVVCGDLKVLPKNSIDKIFISTSGLGEPLPYSPKGVDNIKEGDVIIVSSDIGQHGAAISKLRNSFGFKGIIESDCRNVFPAVNSILNENDHGIKFMRDVTRGGLSAVLNEIRIMTNLSPIINEELIPFHETAFSFFEALGMELIHSSGEGVFVVICSKDKKESTLRKLKNIKGYEKACAIGELYKREDNHVILNTKSGGKRILADYGNTLIPRIC